MKMSEIYTLKEKLNKLETEYYHLHDWFGRYDRLIWTLRSLVFTIYAAIIIYAFDSLKTATTNHFRALVLFALFFLFMETYWLWRYWKKRTLRYKDIQRIVNQTLTIHAPAFTDGALNPNINYPQGPKTTHDTLICHLQTKPC